MRERVRRTVVTGVFLGSSVIATAQESPTVLRAQDVGGAGRVHLQLHAGDYEVRASPNGEVRVSEVRSTGWSGGQTKAQVRVKAGQVMVEVEPPSHLDNSNVHLVIEVPRCRELTLKLSAGELQMKAMPCDANVVDVTAGKLSANLGDGAAFREVKGSATIGEVRATEFAAGSGADHGGFFPSYLWRGPGLRSLAAHVGTGEIDLLQ